MGVKELGKATYSAFRFRDLIWLSAKGKSQNLNDKHSFEQLPFRIFPPIIGFYLISPELALPAAREFIYTEILGYPTNIDYVHIRDSGGDHRIDIFTISMMVDNSQKESDDESAYCVVKDLSSDELLISRSDQPLPAVYKRVFGAAALADCQRYSKDNS